MPNNRVREKQFRQHFDRLVAEYTTAVARSSFALSASTQYVRGVALGCLVECESLSHILGYTAVTVYIKEEMKKLGL